MTHKYTQEEIKFMLDYCSTHSYRETLQEFNEKFNTHISLPALKYMCHVRGVYAHGVKQRPAFTMIHTTRPIGSEYICPDGYVYIKIAEPNKWDLKHRWEWEKHNPPIKEGETFFFLDRNRQNCDINNLSVISKSFIGCFNHLFPRNMVFTQESFAAALNACKLYLEAKEKKRKQRRENPKWIMTDEHRENIRIAQLKRWGKYGKVNKK